MSHNAITVEKLGKRYRIGGPTKRHDTIRTALAQAATAPFRNFAKLRRLDGADDTRDVVWALADVSFELPQGQVLGIIGRNGAGKSTLLKILSRITKPTTGRARVYGRVGALLEVGTGFHSELTGRENIYLNGSILGMDRAYIRRRFDEILDFSGVEKFIDTPVKRYSSGMYLRLAFAVAAHLEPDTLIIDEVLAVGDAQFQNKCLRKMREVGKDGRTVLFVSHNMAAVATLCGRAILIEKGRKVADGEPESVIRDYMRSLHGNDRSDEIQTTDRTGRGTVRFTRLGLEDERGNALEHGVAGQPLVVVLDYQSEDSRPLKYPYRIGLAVYDSMGQALFNCATEVANTELIDLPANGAIRCVIPKLPLSQSDYSMTLFLEAHGEIQDWIRGAKSLSVMNGDFYKTGVVSPRGWEGRGVLVEHRWRFGQSE